MHLPLTTYIGDCLAKIDKPFIDPSIANKLFTMRLNPCV